MLRNTFLIRDEVLAVCHTCTLILSVKGLIYFISIRLIFLGNMLCQSNVTYFLKILRFIDLI